MRAFVIADAHGRWQDVKRLIKQERIHRQEVYDRTYVVHLGDLINGTKDSLERDTRTMNEVAWMFDVLLVGNHEIGYWPGYVTKFTDFHYDKDLAALVEEYGWQAAFEFGGVLISHAGLSRYFEDEWESARDAETALNELWERQPDHAVFNTLPLQRGGISKWGGLLWSDAMEGKSRRFSQVYGHTPQDRGVRIVKPSKFGEVQHVCIDLGAKKDKKPLAGAWIDPDGAITPVTLRERTITYDPAGG